MESNTNEDIVLEMSPIDENENKVTEDVGDESNNEVEKENKQPDEKKADNEIKHEEEPDNVGLTDKEVAHLRIKYGYNEIVSEKPNACLQFLEYFKGPVPFMIEAAAIASIALLDYVDFCLITFLLVLNAVLGWNEEREAGNAVEALLQNLAHTVHVLRNGKWEVLSIRELVPGDQVRIAAGEVVPADADIIHAATRVVQLDQSALTGESLPRSATSGDQIMSGSVLMTGECTAKVTATGADTFIGKTASLVAQTDTSSHFHVIMLKIGDFLIFSGVIISLIVLILALIRHVNFGRIVQFTLLLLISSIPVAMPTVLSITLAIGARFLSQRDAIVTRLTSIESLASVDVLCSDKTGTLTKNELAIKSPLLPCRSGKFSPQQVLTYAALAARLDGDEAIDRCIARGVRSSHVGQIEDVDLTEEMLQQQYEVLHFTPFDPVSKRASAIVRDKSTGKRMKCAKGAPGAIGKLFSLRSAQLIRKYIDETARSEASHGLRALCVAVAQLDEDLVERKMSVTRDPSEDIKYLEEPAMLRQATVFTYTEDDEGEERRDRWEFVGFILFSDPPRDDSAHVIQRLQELGVSVKMITGDQKIIGVETARVLGMGVNFIGGDEMRHMAESDIVRKIDDIDGFGEMYPEDKYKIVTLLEEKGHTVGMTGDGVNDAAALKVAGCGFAVHGATDAARSAASVVLGTPGLSVIVDAIEISRQIFARMTSYVTFRVAASIYLALVLMLLYVAYDLFLPPHLTTILAIMTDISVATIAYDHGLPGSRTPCNWSLTQLFGQSFMVACMLTVESMLLAVYLDVHDEEYSDEQIYTGMFLSLSIGTHLLVFSLRSQVKYFFELPPTFPLTSSVAVTQILATVFAAEGLLMDAIGWKDVGLIWAYSIAWFLFIDIAKRITYRIATGEGLLKPRQPEIGRRHSIVIPKLDTASRGVLRRQSSFQ